MMGFSAAIRSTSAGRPAMRPLRHSPPSTCSSMPSYSGGTGARRNRDWAQADEIRDRLKEAGIR